MSKVKVSTILPTYNRANILGRAIESVLVQQEKDDELIVIDDGSTDNTREVAAKYGDQIKYVRTANQGAGKARNLGLKIAQNDLLAFLDSDDEWMPGKLKLQRAFMEACPDVIFCFSDLAYSGPDGQTDRFTLKNWYKGWPHLNEILALIGKYSDFAELPENTEDFDCFKGSLYVAELSANYVNVNTLMAHRKGMANDVYFAEDLPTYEDWEFFGRLARQGQTAFLQCETAWQHGHHGPRLTDAGRLKMAEARIKIIERVWGNDADFLKNHHKLYKNILSSQYLIAAHRLIASGRSKEARAMLHKAGSAPYSYRLLAALPGPLLKPLFSLKRYLFRSRRE